MNADCENQRTPLATVPDVLEHVGGVSEASSIAGLPVRESKGVLSRIDLLGSVDLIVLLNSTADNL